MGENFTTKEIVIGISEKLDKFIDKQDIIDERQDNRIAELETHRERIMGNFRLVAYILSGSGFIGGLIALVSMLTK